MMQKVIIICDLGTEILTWGFGLPEYFVSGGISQALARLMCRVFPNCKKVIYVDKTW